MIGGYAKRVESPAEFSGALKEAVDSLAGGQDSDHQHDHARQGALNEFSADEGAH